MRKLALITTAAVALVVAGMAIAHGVNSKSVQAVSATFTAATASNVRTTTCTGANGHVYATTKASYTGATAGATDPGLSGAISFDTRSLIDTTTGDGTLSGKLRIAAAGDNTDAHFDAVVHGGSIVGLAEGHAGSPHGDLLANISATYSAAGGFTGGMIGGGTAAGFAVELNSPGGCKPVPAPKPDRVEVHGAVTAVSATSITAAGVTCQIPTDLQAKVAGLELAAGDRVELRCTSAGGTTTLTRIEAKAHGHDDHGTKKKKRKD
jgi:hypothetical protein